MTPDLFDCVSNALAAERAGDVSAALDWHQAVPMFQRGRHRALVERLCLLGGDLPEWVWARWIAYQAIRCEDGDTGDVARDQLCNVIETVHEDLLQECFDASSDPMRVTARILGESWIFHQVAVHESRGLTAFIDEFATGALADHAGLARSWAGARMSGFQLGDNLDGARLQVREAGAETGIDVLDLGARSCATPERWVIGRLVPSGIGDRLMFDMPPLGVPEQVAHDVASAAETEWPEILSAAAQQDGLSSRVFLREDYELGTDVQELDLVRFGTAPRDLGRVMQQLREGRDESSRAAFRILRRAVVGDLRPADQAHVAAAVQFPKAYDDARRRLVRPGQDEAWAAWAECVPEPARARLLSLSDLARVAA